jgi:hypothetical protein
MMTDTVLKCRGMDVLTKSLGLVDTERFISLMLREPFDYTEWQRELYKDVSLDEFYAQVKAFHAIKTFPTDSEEL